MGRRSRKNQTRTLSPRAAELVRAGWSRRHAEQLLVVELALTTVAQVGVEGAPVLATHAMTALAREPVRAGAAQLFTEPEHAAGWRRLAEHLDGDARSLLLDLAAAADGRQLDCGGVDQGAVRITAEDLRLYGEAQAAESRGDLRRAVQLLDRSVRPVHDAWRDSLETVLRHGETLTAAEWGRFTCSMALRWAQSTSTGIDRGIAYARSALRALGASEDQLDELAVTRAGYDQVVHDAVLFDEGGLAIYLGEELAPVVAARTPGLGAWAAAPIRLVVLVGPAGEDALVEDLLTGEQRLVGDRGLAAEHPPGRIFYGRLVQVDGDARWFFAVLPTVVPAQCVADVLLVLDRGGDAEERVDALHRGLQLKTAEQGDFGHDRPAA